MDFIFDPSLVLYLPLYELNGASFMSKDRYGHLCTVTGALWRPDGYYCDGVDDKIVIPTHSAFSLPDRLTVEWWVYLDSASSVLNGAVKHLFDAGANNTKAFNWYWDDRGGAGKVNNVLFRIFGTTPSTISLGDNASFVTRWYHLVGTYDRQLGGTEEQKLYLDSNIKATADFSETLDITDEDIWLGANNQDSAYSEIRVGEVRIYNRALSPLEIQHNYLATKWRYR